MAGDPYQPAINEAPAQAVRDSGLQAAEAARVELLLTTLAFFEAQHRTGPAGNIHDNDALAAFAAQAPLSTELQSHAAQWPAGAHLDWAIDLALAHIRALTPA